VLYDRLVSNDVLDLVGEGARLLYVGKTAGYHSRTQVSGKDRSFLVRIRVIQGLYVLSTANDMLAVSKSDGWRPGVLNSFVIASSSCDTRNQ
jgi:siroheme synthase